MPLDASTSITIGGVQAWDEGTEEDFNKLASSAVRRLCCAWGSRGTLTTFLLGGTTQNGVIQTLSPPARYPDASFLIADSVRITGEGVLSVAASGMVAYQWAHLEVFYKTSDLELLSEDIGTLSMTGSSQIIMPSQAEPTFKWSSDNKDLPPEATPGVLVPTIEFTKTRRNLATIPTAMILSLMDHVNSSTFEGASAGKILFTTPNSSARITPAGLRNIDMAYTFIYHPYGHNKFLRPSTGTWDSIVTKVGSNPPHLSGDLSLLFAP